MARTRYHWSDVELMAIMKAIVERDRQFPSNNAAFLDAFIDDVRDATGRIYGAGQYSTLLRNLFEQTGVKRRPSTTTVNQAVARAHTLKRIDLGVKGDSAPVDTHALRRALEPMLRELLDPLLMPRVEAGRGVPSASSNAARLQATEASLAEALAHSRRQDEEIGRLQREVGRATMRAEVAEGNCREMLSSLHQAISASATGAEQLTKVVEQLRGTEAYLKLQHDAVRLQVTSEVDRLRVENDALKKDTDRLILQGDQMRRALAAAQQGRGGAAGAM